MCIVCLKCVVYEYVVASVCSVCGECMCIHAVMYVWCALVDGNEEGDSDQTKQRTFGANGPLQDRNATRVSRGALERLSMCLMVPLRHRVASLCDNQRCHLH